MSPTKWQVKYWDGSKSGLFDTVAAALLTGLTSPILSTSSATNGKSYSTLTLTVRGDNMKIWSVILVLASAVAAGLFPRWWTCVLCSVFAYHAVDLIISDNSPMQGIPVSGAK